MEYLANQIWSMLGVLVSGIGLWQGYKQLRRVADESAAITRTYEATIKDLEKRETISNISYALGRLEIIKNGFQRNDIDGIASELSSLAKILTILPLEQLNGVTKTEWSTYINLCTELELKIVGRTQDKVEKKDIVTEITQFTSLELKLVGIQRDLKYNK